MEVWEFWEECPLLLEVWTVGHVRHVSLRFLILRRLVGTGHHLQLGMCHLHMGQVLRGKGDGSRHLGFVLKDGGISGVQWGRIAQWQAIHILHLDGARGLRVVGSVVFRRAFNMMEWSNLKEVSNEGVRLDDFGWLPFFSLFYWDRYGSWGFARLWSACELRFLRYMISLSAQFKMTHSHYLFHMPSK